MYGADRHPFDIFFLLQAISASRDGELRVWNVRRMAYLRRFQLDQGLEPSALVAIGGEYIAVGCVSGEIQVSRVRVQPWLES